MALGGRRFLGGTPFPISPVRLKCRLTLRMGYEFKQAEVCEIHRDGLYVRSGEPWPEGSPVDIEMYMLDETVPMIGTGSVDHVDHYAMRVAGVVPRMSIRFVDFGHKGDSLQNWIDHGLYLRKVFMDNVRDFTKYALYELRGDRFEKDFGEPGSGFRHPIMLIHGFLGTRGAMLPLENRLKHLGYPVFSINLGGLNVSDIRKSAQRIADSVVHILDKYKMDRMDVIGHSMGGLIGLHYIKHMGGHRHVRKMISIGTPYYGAYSAMLGVALFGALSKSSWQLLKKSEFVKELHKGELPEGPGFYSIMAKNDELCWPEDCALAGARNYMVAGGHSTLVTGDESFSFIRAILGDRDPLPFSIARSGKKYGRAS